MRIGVDGGGTRTTAVAMSEDGKWLARAVGEGINFRNIGMDAARENLRRTVNELLQKTGEPSFSRMTVGLSALDADADEATTRAFAGSAFPPERLQLVSDAYAALVGATEGEPGMMVICGTGAMLVLLDEAGEQHVSSGWGWIVGDPGSGYALAVDGLRAAIADDEGRGVHTVLLQAMMAHFAIEQPRALIDTIYPQRVDVIAHFAVDVVSAAEAGDAAAREILTRHMRTVALQAERLAQACPAARTLSLYGGIFQHSAWVRDLFLTALAETGAGLSVVPVRQPPEIGALIAGLMKDGRWQGKMQTAMREGRIL